MTLKDITDRLRKQFEQPARNLRAWGQVARSPQLRQEYGQRVVQPTVQRFQQKVRTPYPQLRQQNLQQAQQQPWFQHPIVQQARKAVTPPPTIFGTKTIFGEAPQMPQIREKLGRAEGLTPEEKKIAQRETMFAVADIALTGPKKPVGQIPKSLEPLAKEARKLGISPESKVHVVGSSATGKITPTSDIDIVIEGITKEQKSKLQKIFNFYNKDNIHFVSSELEKWKPYKTVGSLKDFYTQATKGVGGKIKMKGELPKPPELQIETTTLKAQTKFPQGNLENLPKKSVASSEIITQQSKPLTETQAILDWEKAVKNEYQTITLKQLNKQKASQFAKEQVEMTKSLGGVKAYKGGKQPATAKGFPATALEGATKDKGAFSYQRETLLRNIEDTFGTKSQEVKQYFHDPILANETANVKFQNQLNTKIKKVFKTNKINKGSAEDYAAADFIEGSLKLADLKKKFPEKWKGIVKTAEEGRAIYEDLLTKVNTELTKYGYSPIPKRQNYVTHTQEIQTFMDTIGNLTNLNKDKLPTAMANIHLYTKPGRQFFKFGLKRTGESTHEGLATALEKYIYPTGNQIFHTGDIQRGRALEQYLMKTNEGTQSRVLSNFQSYLSQYVDSLAGKQNIIDRPIEKVFGRGALKAGNYLRKKTGANMVGGNVSSALTNFIPFTQSVATTSKPAMVKGLFEGAMSPANGLTIIDGVESRFLVRRFPEQGLKSKGQKIVGTAGALFKWVDGFTVKSVVSGKYFEGVGKGMGKQEAMVMADEYAARVFADRSFGQIPLVFKSKTLGAFTQFQTEVNNQVSFLLKDIPKNLGYNKAQVASALGQFVLYAYLFNNLYEKVTGRRPQIDVLHAGISTYQKVKAGEEVKNIVNPMDQNTPVGEIVQNLPFTSIMSGGRIPIGSAVPNPLAIASGTSTFGKELKKPLYYILPPTGGGQIRKTIEGIKAYAQGYSQTDTGKIRFPIAKDAQNLARSAIFGQYSSPEARQYFDENRKPLSEKQSELFKLGATELYDETMFDRQVNKEKEALKEGGKAAKSQQVSPGIYQLSDGSFTSKVGKSWKTFDTGDEAQLAIDKEKFRQSGKNLKVIGDNVFRLSKSGEITTTSKIDYETSLVTQKMENAKTDDDFKTWMKLAKKQFENYQTQLQDPTLDELEKMELQQKIDALVASVAKYAGYGGFKKGKKPPKITIRTVTPGKVSFKPISSSKMTFKGATAKVPSLKMPAYQAPKLNLSGISTQTPLPRIKAPSGNFHLTTYKPGSIVGLG